MKSLLWPILAIIFTSGCDQSEITLQAEETSQSQLLKELQQRQAENLQDYDQISIQLDSEQRIRVQGNSAQVAKIVNLANQLDKPRSYYLEVSNSNNKRYSTSNREQSTQVLLSPGQTVTLGELSWQSTPWQHYRGITSNRVLELTLSEELLLNISIKNEKNNQASFLSGQYQLRENQWIKLMDNQKITTNKHISTQNKKQLWLRLHPIEI